MAAGDDFVRITLRIPAGLHAALNESAAKKRSMNAEIIDRLERSFSPGRRLSPQNLLRNKERRLLADIEMTLARLEAVRDEMQALSDYQPDDSTPG